MAGQAARPTAPTSAPTAHPPCSPTPTPSTGSYISYPRTETEVYRPDFDLTSLIQAQAGSTAPWAAYAGRVLAGEVYRAPRGGGRDDKAHPPIHPTKAVAGGEDWPREKRQLYEFVARSFLASVSRPAEGLETRVELAVGHETFWTRGLMITDRAWLDVYPYTTWGGQSPPLPVFAVGQRLAPAALDLVPGRTQPPPRLAEGDLLAAMDAFGIGTDATMVRAAGAKRGGRGGGMWVGVLGCGWGC